MSRPGQAGERGGAAGGRGDECGGGPACDQEPREHQKGKSGDARRPGAAQRHAGQYRRYAFGIHLSDRYTRHGRRDHHQAECRQSHADKAGCNHDAAQGQRRAHPGGAQGEEGHAERRGEVGIKREPDRDVERGHVHFTLKL
jgi:hypothetical protein